MSKLPYKQTLNRDPLVNFATMGHADLRAPSSCTCLPFTNININTANSPLVWHYGTLVPAATLSHCPWGQRSPLNWLRGTGQELAPALFQGCMPLLSQNPGQGSEPDLPLWRHKDGALNMKQGSWDCRIQPELADAVRDSAQPCTLFPQSHG